MSNENTIRTWHQTIDFESLMREARKHITHLAGNLWTDHNASDPGITQLEVLAFCIADLSYRTSFDVKDILTGYKGEKALDIDLPLADAVLPNNPVSIKDLRKVLIDMPHPENPKKLLIRNAFPIIAENTEIPFYAVSRKGQDTFLSFDTSFEYKSGLAQTVSLAEVEKEEASLELGLEDKSVSKKNPVNQQAAAIDNLSNERVPKQNIYQSINDYPVFQDTTIKKKFENIDEIILNGLYSLQIEFEEQEANEAYLKNLNQNYFETELEVDGQDYIISVLLPYWDDIKWSLRNVNLSSVTLSYRKRGKLQLDDYFIAVDKLNYDDYFYDYYAEIDLGGHKITAFIKVKTKSIHSIEINGKTLEFDVNFLDWNELSNGVKRDYDLPTPKQVNAQSAFQEVNNVSIDSTENIYDIQSKFTYPKNNGNTKIVKLLTRITFKENTTILDSEEIMVIIALKNKFKELYDRQIKLENTIYTAIGEKNTSIYSNYLAKINRVFDLLYFNKNSIDNISIWKYLGNFRNVCEDYSKFSASRVQEIALFGKLDVTPDFNIVELLSEIYFRIDQFLCPLVKFNALSEMLEKKYTFNEIFNGPLLTNGFIEDKDLDDLKRRSVVYTSDLVRIIMDVPGVKSIEDFNISSYID
ncbi:MAG: hypothetical protein MK066_14855, partial [Crocinitomicaceae bacterium]|nr:hypothetical protein [Crocinitomicaceae bacterium]